MGVCACVCMDVYVYLRKKSDDPPEDAFACSAPIPPLLATTHKMCF